MGRTLAMRAANIFIRFSIFQEYVANASVTGTATTILSLHRLLYMQN